LTLRGNYPFWSIGLITLPGMTLCSFLGIAIKTDRFAAQLGGRVSSTWFEESSVSRVDLFGLPK